MNTEKTRSLRAALAAALLAALALPVIPALARTADVDVELVLAVDVSLSMSFEELEIQRRGYASALTDPAVVKAITGGLHGRIAITYFEWAGDTSHRLVVPWRTIASRTDAEAVAAELLAALPQGQRRTSITGAIREAARLLKNSPYRGVKRVIDISGDGANNQGGLVTEARDETIAKGITINGLPLMTNFGPARGFSVPDLDRYYADCVIGGPGAFTIPVTEWSQFPEAVRRKLVLELARRPDFETARVFRVTAKQPAYDCLAGEKLWEKRMNFWGDR